MDFLKDFVGFFGIMLDLIGFSKGFHWIFWDNWDFEKDFIGFLG